MAWEQLGNYAQKGFMLMNPTITGPGSQVGENQKGRSEMPTVKLLDEDTTDPRVRAVFDDIKATKKIDHIPALWRALATHPQHLELCWTRLKAIMRPGKVDLLTLLMRNPGRVLIGTGEGFPRRENQPATYSARKNPRGSSDR